MDEPSIECLLHVDYQIILASSTYEVHEMITKMNDSVNTRGMEVNVSKNKVMVLRGDASIYRGVAVEREGGARRLRIKLGDHLTGFFL
ncbi:hypothetical protein EVAR_38812_1 [Eumeta japonica]|uniref:Reverse transcriptase domain-containing protein n=1 Tax=Eumeta variegata TaxID=151549 RepID=A0A4C1XSF8_EUMVA|nr:hypothetical protein EVAR_38812_1 [Eumeta japonica]